MKKIFLLALLAVGITVSAQSEYQITVQSKKPSGIIDEMLYGQLLSTSTSVPTMACGRS